MQFEEFDDKIKQAADHHHPAYDEQAWTKMEKLLNKHMPQKEEKKRRFIFFLLFFLLMGGGAWLLISKPWDGSSKMTGPVSSEKNSADKPAQVITPDKKESTVSVGTENINVNTEQEKEPAAETGTTHATAAIDITISVPRKNDNKMSSIAGAKNKKSKDRPLVSMIDNNKKPFKNATVPESKSSSVIPEKEIINLPPPPVEETLKLGERVVKKENPVVTEIKKPAEGDIKPEQDKTDVKEATIANPVAEKKKKNKKSTKSNSFFFNLSAGPDLSFVGSGNSGKVKLLTGAGVGFTFKDKLTIRTGFYTGRKIYTAGPDDYNPPASFWTYYPYLEKIEADCKVYEIPLSLSYNFGHTTKQNWFASAGISSLLMKKETYNYFYKYAPYAPTITKEWTIENENKHYFSILTLSAGYQRKLGTHVSIIAEPYVKLPLSGVGFGKVKLNSAGLLVTVGVNPFNKVKPKPIEMQ